MYGIPFPGNYLIAPDGTVRDKLFLPDYQRRATAGAVITRNFATQTGWPAVKIETPVLDAIVSFSTDRCFAGQEIGVRMAIDVKRGWHIYGQPLPPNYRAVELVFESPVIDSQSLEMPTAKPMPLKALNETLPIYRGKIEAVGSLGIRWSPPVPVPFMEALGKKIEPGLYMIRGELHYQACSDTTCEPPTHATFEFPLTIEPGIPPLPTR